MQQSLPGQRLTSREPATNLWVAVTVCQESLNHLDMYVCMYVYLSWGPKQGQDTKFCLPQTHVFKICLLRERNSSSRNHYIHWLHSYPTHKVLLNAMPKYVKRTFLLLRAGPHRQPTMGGPRGRGRAVCSGGQCLAALGRRWGWSHSRGLWGP